MARRGGFKGTKLLSAPEIDGFIQSLRDTDQLKTDAKRTDDHAAGGYVPVPKQQGDSPCAFPATTNETLGTGAVCRLCGKSGHWWRDFTTLDIDKEPPIPDKFQQVPTLPPGLGAQQTDTPKWTHIPAPVSPIRIPMCPPHTQSQMESPHSEEVLSPRTNPSIGVVPADIDLFDFALSGENSRLCCMDVMIGWYPWRFLLLPQSRLWTRSKNKGTWNSCSNPICLLSVMIYTAPSPNG